MTKRPARVAIYTRISEDDLGRRAGVARQLADLRRLAKDRGWPVVAEIEDNDVSAFTGRRRPGYLRLMEMVEAQGIDRVLVVHQSRLWRNRRERADGLERLVKSGVSLSALNGPEIDLGSAAGRMLAGVLGEFDSYESDVKSERVIDASRARAERGQANGAVAYGWRREIQYDDQGRRVGFRDVEDPAAADVVRSIVSRLLAGDSMRAITADLTAAGDPGPTGKGWRHSSVRKVALRESNVGLRVRAGQVIGRAAWPPIVDEGDHARVKALLGDPARRTFRDASRKHLLSGSSWATCGVCGAVLRVARHGKWEMYACAGRGCVGRSRTLVDERVAAFTLARLSAPDALVGSAAVADAAHDARRELVRLRARLDDAATAYAAGRIDLEQMTTVTKSLRPQMEAAQAQVSRYLAADPGEQGPVLDLLGADDPAAAWLSMTVLAQRQVLAVIGVKVVIHPTRQGGSWNPADVEISFGQALVDAASGQ